MQRGVTRYQAADTIFKLHVVQVSTSIRFFFVTVLLEHLIFWHKPLAGLRHAAALKQNCDFPYRDTAILCTVNFDYNSFSKHVVLRFLWETGCSVGFTQYVDFSLMSGQWAVVWNRGTRETGPDVWPIWVRNTGHRFLKIPLRPRHRNVFVQITLLGDSRAENCLKIYGPNVSRYNILADAAFTNLC